MVYPENSAWIRKRERGICALDIARGGRIGLRDSAGPCNELFAVFFCIASGAEVCSKSKRHTDLEKSETRICCEANVTCRARLIRGLLFQRSCVVTYFTS